MQNFDPNTMQQGSYPIQNDYPMPGGYPMQNGYGMFGQPMPGAAPFVPNGQFGQPMFDPNSMPSYGQQWQQYEAMAAQQNAEQQAESAENTANAAATEPVSEGAGGVDADAAAADTETEDETQFTGAGYGGDMAYLGAMPVYGYDAGYMPEFGGDEIVPYDMTTMYVPPVNDQPSIDGNQPVVKQKWRAHPILVFSMLLVCFPVGLAFLLFYTDWGVFPKIYITLFTLAIALAVYEILVAKQALVAPSLINELVNLFK